MATAARVYTGDRMPATPPDARPLPEHEPGREPGLEPALQRNISTGTLQLASSALVVEPMIMLRMRECP